MALNGIIAKYHLEDWFKKSFSPKERECINSLFPDFINGVYNKNYSSALALATNIVPALDLPDDKYFEYRKINSKVQEKIIKQALKLIKNDTPLIEQHIIYNIIIYYITRHQGIFIDSERAIEFSERQMNIFPEVSKIIDEYKSSYSEFDLKKNYGYETLYKIYEQRGDKDKILELLQKKQSKKDSNSLDEQILNDDALINSYCEQTYKEIFEKNPSLFLHNALPTLEYPKSMKPWIELLFICDKSNSSDFINIENPIEKIKTYSCYIGIILNFKEAIQNYLKLAQSLFPNNEVHISPKNSCEILINLTSKDVVEKKNIFTNPNEIAPWCHYHAEIARYLNQCGFKIDLNTIVVNYMVYMFDFLEINNEFQKNFDIVLQSINTKYFIQKEIQTFSFVPSLFTEDAVRNYLLKNADSIINESWHSLTGFFYGNNVFDSLPSNFSSDLEEFYLIDFISAVSFFPTEHKIKDIFSDKFEQQQEYFSVIPLKPTANIEKYLQSAKEMFPNHKVEYDLKSSKMHISIEKNDFSIKQIDSDIINQIMDNAHEDFLKVTKQNKNAKYPDEYIDLKSYAEYIFASASYLFIEYRIEYFEKLKQLLETFDKSDFADSEYSTISTLEKDFEIDYSIYNKIDFKTDKSFINYSDSLKNDFVKTFETTIVNHWKYFRPNYFVKDYEHILSYLSLPTEYFGMEETNIKILYDFSNIAEDVYSDEDTKFIPIIDISDKRDYLLKQKECLTCGINLNFIKLETIKERLDAIFQNHNINVNIAKRMAVLEIPVGFSDFDIITKKEKLEMSFNKHLGFIKLAYAINLQCKSEEHPEYIKDKDLLLTIAYSESKYLVSLKKEFYDKLEQFFYAIGKENLVEKYDKDGRNKI